MLASPFTAIARSPAPVLTYLSASLWLVLVSAAPPSLGLVVMAPNPNAIDWAARDVWLYTQCVQYVHSYERHGDSDGVDVAFRKELKPRHEQKVVGEAVPTPEIQLQNETVNGAESTTNNETNVDKQHFEDVTSVNMTISSPNKTEEVMDDDENEVLTKETGKSLQDWPGEIQSDNATKKATVVSDDQDDLDSLQPQIRQKQRCVHFSLSRSYELEDCSEIGTETVETERHCKVHCLTKEGCVAFTWGVDGGNAACRLYGDQSESQGGHCTKKRRLDTDLHEIVAGCTNDGLTCDSWELYLVAEPSRINTISSGCGLAREVLKNIDMPSCWNYCDSTPECLTVAYTHGYHGRSVCVVYPHNNYYDSKDQTPYAGQRFADSICSYSYDRSITAEHERLYFVMQKICIPPSM